MTVLTDRQVRSFQELRDIPDDADLPKVIDEYNEMVDAFNFLGKNLSLQSNFNCQIIDVEFTAGQTKRVFHRLGIVPRYRLVLRQEGNGLITDVPLSWTDKYITLVNNGAVAIKATIMLVKE